MSPDLFSPGARLLGPGAAGPPTESTLGLAGSPGVSQFLQRGLVPLFEGDLGSQAGTVASPRGHSPPPGARARDGGPRGVRRPGGWRHPPPPPPPRIWGGVGARSWATRTPRWAPRPASAASWTRGRTPT